jgi:flagellar biosynthesis protein FliQ
MQIRLNLKYTDFFDPMSWIIRILLLSLIVGLVISFFNINPMGILNDTWDTILAVGGLFKGVLDWALPYILVGAVVVVPIALIGALLRFLRQRR